jgi:alpha-1,2-mannosyltransferase
LTHPQISEDAMAKWAAALSVVHLALVWAVILFVDVRPIGEDFFSYFGATRVIAEGGDPYSLREIRRIALQEGWRGPTHPFLYPPTALPFFAWCTPLPFRPAYVLWALGMQAALLGVIATFRVGWRHLVPDAGWIALLVLAAYFPTYDAVWLGQITPLVLALTLAGAHFASRSREWTGGALLGVAIALKVSPAIFLPWLAWRGHRRAAASALLVGLALVAFVWGSGHGPLIWQYAGERLPGLAAGQTISAGAVRMPGNVSILHALDLLTGTQGPIISQTVRLATMAAQLGIAVATLAWLGTRRASKWRLPAEIAVLCGVSQLMVTLFSTPSLLWVLPALVFLWAAVRAALTTRIELLVTLASTIVLAVPPSVSELPGVVGLPPLPPLEPLKTLCVVFVLMVVARIANRSDEELATTSSSPAASRAAT